jgi:hypothetical protein
VAISKGEKPEDEAAFADASPAPAVPPATPGAAPEPAEAPAEPVVAGESTPAGTGVEA